MLGLLLLAVAAWFASGRAERRHASKVAAAVGRPKKPSVSDRLLGGSRATMAFAAGMLLTLPSALYLAALKDIAEAGVSTAEELLAILLFNVLMLSPALIPLVLLVVVPDGTKAAVERSDRWMREHQKRLVTVVAGVIGVYLTAKGIVARRGDRPYTPHAGQKAARSAWPSSVLRTNPQEPQARKSAWQSR